MPQIEGTPPGVLGDVVMHVLGDTTLYRTGQTVPEAEIVRLVRDSARKQAAERDVAADALRVTAANQSLAKARSDLDEAARQGNTALWNLISMLEMEARRAREVIQTRDAAVARRSDLAARRSVTEAAGCDGWRAAVVSADGRVDPGFRVSATEPKAQVLVDGVWTAHRGPTYGEVRVAEIMLWTFVGLPTPEQVVSYADGNHTHYQLTNVSWEAPARASRVSIDGDAFDLPIEGSWMAHLFRLWTERMPTSARAFPSWQQISTTFAQTARQRGVEIVVERVTRAGDPLPPLRFDRSGKVSRGDGVLARSMSATPDAIAVLDSEIQSLGEDIARADRMLASMREGWVGLRAGLAEMAPDLGALVDPLPEDPNVAVISMFTEHSALEAAARKAAEAEANLALVERQHREYIEVVGYFDDLDSGDARAADFETRHVLQSLGSLRKAGLVTTDATGWSLTATGLRKSVDVRPQFSTVNVTSRWLEVKLDRQMVDAVISHLAHKCARSAGFNELGDLLHIYIDKVVARDGFRERIAEGRQPNRSNLKAWVYRSALSQFRDEGRDALTRSFKGARTEQDLKAVGGELAVKPPPDAIAKVVTLADDDSGQTSAMVGSGSVSGGPLIDVVGGNMEAEAFDQLAFEQGYKRLEAIVRAHGRDGDQMLRILRYCTEGLTIPEVAEREGMTRNQAVGLMNNVRSLFRSAEVDILRRVRRANILSYVSEEPFSSLDDLTEDLGEAVATPEVVAQLVREGCLTVTDEGCLQVTRTGRQEVADLEQDSMSTTLVGHLIQNRQMTMGDDGHYTITAQGAADLDAQRTRSARVRELHAG